MEKKSIVRWQLLVLAGITLLMFYRVVKGPPSPDGLVVMDDLEPQQLARRAFSLSAPTRLQIRAEGAFDPRSGDATQLAAYAWILDHATREPVWRMDPSANTSAGRGLQALSEDSVLLPAGDYEVYFAAYGAHLSSASLQQEADRGAQTLFRRLFDADARWQDDARDWMVVIQEADRNAKGESARAVGFDELPRLVADNLLWSATRVDNGALHSQTFRLDAPATLAFRATGEVTSDVNDFGAVENLTTGETLWRLTLEDSEPAGGAVENRRAHGTLSLDPGIYRATYRTDRTHAYDAWLANPPYDPESWGMSVTASTPADVLAWRMLDPARDGVPIATIDRVGNDVFKAAYVMVNEPAVFLVRGMGEMTDDERFDFGWMERIPPAEMNRRAEREPWPDAATTIWEMTYEASTHAGGSDDNREQFEALRLTPGAYALYYRSDYAHAYGDWRRDRPAASEDWGITLYALRETDPAAFTLRGMRDYHRGEGPEPLPAINPVPPVPPVIPPALATLPPVPGDVLVNLAPMSSNMRQEATFTLESRATVYIRSIGEISLSGNPYDYGWIANAVTGERVWTLTRENTTPAGGGSGNRMFDGQILLEAGQYTAHFETDATHAYGDFDKEPPAAPEAWGMVVSRLHETP